MTDKRWRKGGIEPKVEDLLTDPIVHLVLRRDHITVDDVWAAIARARGECRMPAA